MRSVIALLVATTACALAHGNVPHAKGDLPQVNLGPVRMMNDVDRLADLTTRLAEAREIASSARAAAERATASLKDATRALQPHWESHGSNSTAVRSDIFSYARLRTRAVVSDRSALWHTARSEERKPRSEGWKALATSQEDLVTPHLASDGARAAWEAFKTAVEEAAAAKYDHSRKAKHADTLAKDAERVEKRISNAQVRQAKRASREQADKEGQDKVNAAAGDADKAKEEAKKAAEAAVADAANTFF